MTTEDFFDSLQVHYEAELPFVVYNVLSSQKIKATLQEENTIFYTTDFKESGFVFAPFDFMRKAIFIPNDYSNCYEINHPVNYKYQSNPDENRASSSDKLNHMQLVQKGINAIENSELQKVVLSRRETITCTDSNPIDLFRQLLSAYPKAFVYCWYHPKIGLWLGATPEVLIKVKGNRFSTMALAGTQMYNGTLEVIWNEKELNEQQIVTDYLINCLEPITINLQTTEAQTIKAANVLHLKTDVLGTIDKNKAGLIEILDALHPTPAVNGFPKEKAKEFILEHEDYDREYYTGFLGEINIKETVTRNSNRRNVENNAYGTVKEVSNLYVNLRCMQLKGEFAHIYVGGGITRDSIAEDEWYETINKTLTIKNCL